MDTMKAAADGRLDVGIIDRCAVGIVVHFQFYL